MSEGILYSFEERVHMCTTEDSAGKKALRYVQRILKIKLDKWDKPNPFHSLDGNADNWIQIERFIDEKGGLEHIKQLDRNLYDLLEVHSILLQYGS